MNPFGAAPTSIFGSSGGGRTAPNSTTPFGVNQAFGTTPFGGGAGGGTTPFGSFGGGTGGNATQNTGDRVPGVFGTAGSSTFTSFGQAALAHDGGGFKSSPFGQRSGETSAKRPFGASSGQDSSLFRVTTPFGQQGSNGSKNSFGDGGAHAGNLFGSNAFGSNRAAFSLASDSAPMGGFGSGAPPNASFGNSAPFGGQDPFEKTQFGGKPRLTMTKTSAKATTKPSTRKGDDESDSRKDPAKAIVVSRLPSSIDEQGLRAAFEGFGAIRSVKLVRQQGRPPFAYVNYDDARAALHAAREAHGSDMFGRPIQVVIQQSRATGSQQQPPAPQAGPEAVPFCLKLQPLPPNCTDEQLRRALEQHDASAGLASVKTIHRDGRAYGWVNYVTKREVDAAAGKLRLVGDSLFPGFTAVNCSVRRNPALAKTTDVLPSSQPMGAGNEDDDDDYEVAADYGAEDDAEDNFPPALDDDELYSEDINASQHRTAVFNQPREPVPAAKPSKGDSMSRTVRVDKLSGDVTEAQLKSTFGTFGEVQLVSIQKEGYALVMFNDAADAKLAALELTGVDAFSTGALECRVCSSTAGRASSPPRSNSQRTKLSQSAAAPFKVAKLPLQLDADTVDGPSKAAIVGTCELMCPQSEIDERVRHNELDEWEKPDASWQNEDELRLAARNLAVKRYKRSDAGSVQNVPELVRPPRVLRATLDHLEAHVISRQPVFSVGSQTARVPDEHELATYMFLWNRFRAIRKDFILQNYTKGGLVDATVVNVFERMARYFIAMERRMALHPEWRTGPAHGKHNAESLSETLTALLAFYDMAHARSLNNLSSHEAELTAYWILFFDHEHGAEASRLIERLALRRPDMYGSVEIQLAAEIRACRCEGDYARFFALARESPYLVRCLLVAQEADGVRATALAVMGRAYAKGEAYPAARLARVLGFDSTRDAVDAAREAGYRVTRNRVYFHGCRADEDEVIDAEDDMALEGDADILEEAGEEEAVTGLFDEAVASFASLVDIVSPSPQELEALAKRRRAAARLDSERHAAESAAQHAKRAVAMAKATDRRRATEAADAARHELERLAEARRQAEAKAESERLAKAEADREAALERKRQRLQREAQEAERQRLDEQRERQRIETERIAKEAKEARDRREAEARKRREQEAERLRQLELEKKMRQVEEANERKATAFFKRAALSRLARRCTQRRDWRAVEAKLAAAVWLRVWHLRAARRVDKRRDLEAFASSFDHDVPWRHLSRSSFASKKRRRLVELPAPIPATLSRLVIDVSRAVSPALVSLARGIAPELAISVAPDVLWKLAVVASCSTDVVCFETGTSLPGARVCVGSTPADAAVAIVADQGDIERLASIAPHLDVQAMAVLTLGPIDDSALTLSAASPVAVANVSDVGEALNWLVRHTAKAPVLIRALQPVDLVCFSSASEFNPEPIPAAILEFNQAIVSAADKLDATADEDEAAIDLWWFEPWPEFLEPEGHLARGALVRRTSSPLLEASAALPLDWLARTRLCAARLRRAVVPQCNHSSWRDYVEFLDSTRHSSELLATLETAAHRIEDARRAVLDALLSTRLADLDLRAYRRLRPEDSSFDLPRDRTIIVSDYSSSSPRRPDHYQSHPIDSQIRLQLQHEIAHHRVANEKFEEQLRSALNPQIPATRR